MVLHYLVRKGPSCKSVVEQSCVTPLVTVDLEETTIIGVALSLKELNFSLPVGVCMSMRERKRERQRE